MSANTIYRCAECDSERVQRLKVCWVDANGEADVRPEDVDHESCPGSMGYQDTYCQECAEAGLGIVETPIVTCVACGNVCPNGVAWTPGGGDPHCDECAGFAPMALDILRVVGMDRCPLGMDDLKLHARNVLAKVERYRAEAKT